MQKLIISISLVILGTHLLQAVEVSAENSRFGDEALHQYAQKLVEPISKKTNELNQTLQDYWVLYDQNVRNLDTKLSNVNGLSLMASSNNTCQQLQDAMVKAQSTVNNATVILVEVFQKMALIVSNNPDCLSINIFSDISCFAHKAKDIRSIYKIYKDQLIQINVAAAKELETVLIEFTHCLKRL